LLHQELSDILRRQPDLRQRGTKEIRIRTLWEAQLSEVTLLGELMNRQLEDILHRLGLRLSGSKGARIERIIEHFDATAATALTDSDPVISGESTPAASAPEPEPMPAEIEANQIAFRQRASNPQASLQPWLDALLNAHGLVRCYATEDANPTKQLKNKLSQAAAARDGLLVLLLADEAACTKAREALVERWMENAEWPKSVACIALAHPLHDPNIAVVVERTRNRWSIALRAALFPEAEVVSVASDQSAAGQPTCEDCSEKLPSGARFCPGCGSPVAPV
jgi:hypothetical protein